MDDDLVRGGRHVAAAIGTTTAAVLHLVVGYLTVVSGLVAPPPAVLALVGVWAALAVQLWRWRRRPLLALVVPFVAAAILLLTLVVGEQAFGWTA